ncbi:MAG: type II toxin-antitoxin system Phd/YefM family antitoxin [Acidobacteriota bacterium]|nr:type II toxin-antitoxin system Phd/YefM family antitoxin [Acidobacteriota bacterium]
MIRVNLSEARAQLSRMVDAALRGERVVLCRRNVEIAEIRPLPRPPARQRPTGIDRGLEIPDSFFEPLPEDLLRDFEGRGEPDETA